MLVAAAFGIGYALDPLEEKAATVFAALADVQHFAEWNRNTEKVEMLPPIDGKEATRQTFKGGMVMTIVTAESDSPTHLVRRLGDAGDGGTQVKLTEVAEFKNSLFRVMTRIFGQTEYIDAHL